MLSLLDPANRPSNDFQLRRPSLARLTPLLAIGLVFASSLLRTVSTCSASPGFSRTGVSEAFDPQTEPLLVGYYEAFLRDRNVEAFRLSVASRYRERALVSVLRSGGPRSRQAALMALGLFGSYANNATVARGLRDPDPDVRELTADVLWLLWFRADSPENNAVLGRIRSLNSQGDFEQAIQLADALIARSPTFAEAYNQRAIAYFFTRRYALSIDDCRKVLIDNPYHFGALGGMAQCQLRLGLPKDALETFRRASKLQPYNEGLKEVVAELEKEFP